MISNILFNDELSLIFTNYINIFYSKLHNNTNSILELSNFDPSQDIIFNNQKIKKETVDKVINYTNRTSKSLIELNFVVVTSLKSAIKIMEDDAKYINSINEEFLNKNPDLTIEKISEKYKYKWYGLFSLVSNIAESTLEWTNSDNFILKLDSLFYNPNNFYYPLDIIQ